MADNQQPQKMYPDLAWFEEEDEKPAAAAPAADVAALQKRIDDLTSQLARPVQLPTAAFQQVQPVRPQLSTEVSYDGLPDPVTDPQGYAREVATRIRTADANQKVLDDFDAAQTNQQQRFRDGLWADFQSKHTDYADFDQVEFFAGKEVENMLAQGIDANRFIAANREKFFENVVSRIEKAIPRKQLAKEEEDEPANRTTGMFGGLESGGKTVKTAEDRPQSMFDDVRKWQERTGFHR